MDELIFTTVLSVVAVNIVAFFFIPHWTAVLFMLPTIAVVFVEMLGKSQDSLAQSRASSQANEDEMESVGVMQMAGLHINAATYVCLVISIGLIVDFLVRVFLMADYS